MTVGPIAWSIACPSLRPVEKRTQGPKMYMSTGSIRSICPVPGTTDAGELRKQEWIENALAFSNQTPGTGYAVVYFTRSIAKREVTFLSGTLAISR